MCPPLSARITASTQDTGTPNRADADAISARHASTESAWAGTLAKCSPAMANSRRARINTPDRDHSDPILAPLRDVGLLVEREEAPLRSCDPVSEARDSLLDYTHTSRNWRFLPSALAALWSANVRIRFLGLGATIDMLQSRKASAAVSGAAAPIEIPSIAAAFETCARLIRSHDRCLVRSLAITHFLARRGIMADMVIGVRLRPFAAHSWVQLGTSLLNDRVDHVRSYQPILVL